MANQAALSKQALRLQLKKRRSEIVLKRRTQAQNELCKQLMMEFTGLMAQRSSDREFACVAGFWPFGTEVDVRPFYFWVQEQGAQVCFPAMLSHNHMEFFALDVHNLQEPLPCFLSKPTQSFKPDELMSAGFEQVSPAEIDLIVCPLLGFTPQGARLGYGGGNYDRYLPQLKPSTLSLGIAFAEQECPQLIIEPHDWPLSRILWA